MRPTRHDSGPRSGVTLIELLVVMTIAAIVGGMAIASFAAIGRRASREGAAEDIQGLLRRAQVSAVDSGRGAVARIDPIERSLYGLSSTVEGAWHFEEINGAVTPGARHYDGAVTGATDGHEGAVGLCLEFDGSGDYVDCGSPPIFNQTDGVRVEAWIRPSGAGVGDVLGIMGKSAPGAGYALGLVCEDTSPESYSVQGGFVVEGPVAVQLAAVDEYEIPGLEWSHVAIEFDGYEARLYVNGVLADLDSYRPAPEDGPPAPFVPNPVQDENTSTDTSFAQGARIEAARSENLYIGRAWQPFPPPAGYRDFNGRIDEPRLLSVAGGQRVNLPEGVPIVASEEAIHFDGQGRLDIAYHAGPVCVGVGDPYQAAELDADLLTGSGGPILLRPRNPMPSGGGTVLIGGELIHYVSVSGLQLSSLTRGSFGTADEDHFIGDAVYFARVVHVTPTGVVEREQGTP